MDDIARIFDTDSEIDALLAKALLDGAGIPSMLREENTIPFPSPEYGRTPFSTFVLYVRADQAEEAAPLIAAHRTGLAAPEDEP